ncbi:MAG: SDR family oxidoreductase [Deltaproteobacteria bacterium]|nr:SDR family oxidoreductase [Deltaproteobacteria bacterium]
MITVGRYLVTGGAGFIGSHLCEALLAHQCEVICVDNFLTGRSENIRPLLRNPNFELLEHDIIEPIRISGALAGIFHLASPASPVDYAKFPIETLRVGALGTDNVLQLARQTGCKILVSSTSEVYGDPLEHPQKETYWGNVNPIGPRGCYDESKRYLEALTMAYRRVHGVRTCIIRIFNTYGPRMRSDDGRVVPNFCIQALKGQALTVFGDGTQTRSFCYIDDLIDGILRMFMADDPGPVNLGNPSELPILEFAKRIIAFSGRKLDISYLALPEDDPKTRCPDITKAATLVGWKPKVGLEQGLKKTMEYFQARLQQENRAS